MKTSFALGGSAGIGKAIVNKLLAEGYKVGVIARDQTRLDQIVAEAGDKVAVASADVADFGVLDFAVACLVEKLGAPQVWVNCAMITSFSPFKDMEIEEFHRIVSVTFMGQVHGTKQALKYMPTGNIVNIGSGLTYRSVPLQSAYCAAKHAFNGFTSSVRSELMAEGNNNLHLSLV